MCWCVISSQCEVPASVLNFTSYLVSQGLLGILISNVDNFFFLVFITIIFLFFVAYNGSHQVSGTGTTRSDRLGAEWYRPQTRACLRQLLNIFKLLVPGLCCCLSGILLLLQFFNPLTAMISFQNDS